MKCEIDHTANERVDSIFMDYSDVCVHFKRLAKTEGPMRLGYCSGADWIDGKPDEIPADKG